MKITTQYMTDNDCYKVGRRNQLKGIMVHSTGCAYVPASGWFSRWNKPGVEKCVHAFVDDKEIWVYLPYEMGAWHSGTGGANPANIDHIAFEMCEPGPGASSASYDPAAYEAYTRACIANAVDYCVMLCRQFGFTAADITSHYEGYRTGIASNHSDPKHWFDKHGYSMDQFRREVEQKLKGVIEIMGKAVYVDGLINYINQNSIELDESTGGATGGTTEETTPSVAPTVTYQAYANGRWWAEITGYNDDDTSGYAGVLGKAMSGLYARASKGTIRLRAHQIDGDRWLNWQTNGEDYAGNLGKDIDMIQAELIDCPGYAVEYRVSNPGRDYWAWIRNCDNPTATLQYAGVPGKAIDRVQMRIVEV